MHYKKKGLQPHSQNAAIAYKKMQLKAIVAFPNTAYAARLQPPAGAQSCVFKNAAQTGVCSCVLDSLESRFFTTPDAAPIAAFSSRVYFLLQPRFYIVHWFGTYSCVFIENAAIWLLGLHFQSKARLQVFFFFIYFFSSSTHYCPKQNL